MPFPSTQPQPPDSDNRLSPPRLPAGLVRLACLVAVLVLPCPNRLIAQPNLEYEVKAAFLFNFTRFVTWPEEELPAPEEPFVIGVLGLTNPFENRLANAIRERTVEDRPLAARFGRTLDDIGQTQIVFVTDLPPHEVVQVLGQLEGKPVLTVGEQPGFTAQGGMIRFYLREGRVALEINRRAAEKSELRISSRLLALATLYEPETDAE